jgi:hypothetical protein
MAELVYKLAAHIAAVIKALREALNIVVCSVKVIRKKGGVVVKTIADV